MKISILTIFPELLSDYLDSPVIRRALQKDIAKVDIVDIRDYAKGSFRHIDDSPFGGGPGMVMRCQPVLDALEDVLRRNKEACAPEMGRTLIAALSPRGETYTQKTAHLFAELSHLILICGHYEGMDERIYSHTDLELSIGDYILTGGELASLVIADSVIRLLPGVLKDASTAEESFESGLLEYPQYTQPADYKGDKVPEVLLSGNHEAIRRWRQEEALRITRERRPDLLINSQAEKSD